MVERSIVICGLPESGKTTFLGALWHLITEREIRTSLTFGSLKNADHMHLNTIAARWRDALAQERTEVRSRRIVTMNLLDSSGKPVRVGFPDLSGEAFRRMWEERDCEPEVGEILRSGEGILLFVNADHINSPRTIVQETDQMRALGIVEADNKEELEWDPSVSPTQVKIVDILQMLNSPPLYIGPRRIAVMLSAWDKIIEEKRTPESFLQDWLQLLDQYLKSGDGIEAWRVYGVSAQGGDFETEAEALRSKDIASTRIRLFSGDKESHDLTEPLQWLMQ